MQVVHLPQSTDELDGRLNVAGGRLGRHAEPTVVVIGTAIILVGERPDVVPAKR